MWSWVLPDSVVSQYRAFDDLTYFSSSLLAMKNRDGQQADSREV